MCQNPGKDRQLLSVDRQYPPARFERTVPGNMERLGDSGIFAKSFATIDGH